MGYPTEFDSDVVLETKVLVSRRLEDKKNKVLVLVLVLVLKEKILVLVLTKKSWSWYWS